MIEVENLSKSFGGFPAVKSISFRIPKGEIIALLGPNGAGKTTTMRMMTGYYKPDTGSVEISGYDLSAHRRELQSLIGYLPESAASYSDMLVSDYLLFMAQARGIAADSRATATDRAIERTGLGQYRYRPIHHLSKGYRQRVGIAASILHEPSLLILDEPTSGLDPNQIIEIQGLIRELARDKTVILSTHILKEVEETCNRAIIISSGEVVFDGNLDKLQAGSDTRRFRVTFSGQPDIAAVAASLDASVTPVAGSTVTIEGPGLNGESIFRTCVAKGWTLSELSEEKTGINEVFRRLTSSSKGDTNEQ